MCGILGQIKIENDILRDIDKFATSLNLLAHRGPDDSGIALDENFIFGHRRLSIIDLSSLAKQPMFTNDKKVAITYNGEIYNYKELKKDLIKEGYSFKTDSDTEVLLNGYHCYGINFINRCIGMFAFAIYDKRFRKAYIVRDRIGIKPLYYCLENGRLTFSSEIKGILAFEEIKKKLDISAISSYLSFRYPIFNNTFFDGIFSLAPAHYIEIEKSKLRIVKYWDPIFKLSEQKNDRGEDFYITKLRKILASSIKYKMISDVPVGIILSGGIDSSIITALMSKIASHPIETFTIGYKEKGYNEFEYANMVATKYNTNHHEIKTNGDKYFEILEKLISFKDAPLSIPNEVTQYEMCDVLKKYVTVVLSGSGADEIFYGYGRIFRSTYDYERLSQLDAISDKKLKQLFLNNFKAKYGKINFQNELEHFINIYSYTGLEVKRELLHKSIDIEGIEERIKTKFQSYFDEIESGTYLDRMGFAFIKIHLPGILHHNDTVSMAAGVELRVPFLDHRLVEFALSVPVHYKIKWNSDDSKLKSAYLMSDKISEVYDVPKYILKKAYESEIPREVLYRKKVGFPVPLHLWLGGKFRKYVSQILLNDKAKKREIYDIVNLEKWLNMEDLKIHRGDSRTYQYNMAGKIWMLLNLELFIQKYFD